MHDLWKGNSQFHLYQWLLLLVVFFVHQNVRIDDFTCVNVVSFSKFYD